MPSLFPVFSWQDTFLQELSPAAAVILTGDNGIGAGELAMAMAHKFCGNNAVAGAANPDLLITLPENQNISVAAVRYVTEFLSFAPVSCVRRVAVILRADRMHIAAANALLKTLEEPHTDKSLVLWTPALQQLPATIISRCHVYPAPPITLPEQVEAAFCGGSPLLVKEYPPDWAAILAHHFGQGAAIDVGAAVGALNVKHDYQPGWQQVVEQAQEAGCQINPLCQDWAEKNDIPHRWLEGLLKWVADGVRVAAALPPVFFPAERDILQKLIAGRMHRWLDFYRHLLERRALAAHPLVKELFIRDILYAYRRVCAD